MKTMRAVFLARFLLLYLYKKLNLFNEVYNSTKTFYYAKMKEKGVEDMNKFLFLTFCMFFNVSQAFATITIPSAMKQTLKATAETPSLFNLVASLLIVIVMIYIVGWIYMKLSHINSKQLFKQQDLPLNKPKLISGITLGQNRNLHVVELNNKYLVLGVTPNSINLIKEFDKNEIADTNSIIEKTIKEKNIDELNEKEIVEELFTTNQQKSENKEIEDICQKYL